MDKKKCTKCKVIKEVTEFVKDSRTKDSLFYWCKSCQKEHGKSWSAVNRKKNPWYNSYYHAKQRCNNKHNADYPWYGAKGIKFLLTKEDMKKLWKRDNAQDMKKPTIDRKDVNGNYEYDNCQFLENKENSMKDKVGHMYNGKFIEYCEIGQYDDDFNLVKIYRSQGEASRELKMSQGDISTGIKLNKKRHGFYWKKLEKNNAE